jgi:hypothetical protein
MKNFLYKNLLNFAGFSLLDSYSAQRSLTFAAAAYTATATATATVKANHFSSMSGGKNVNMILKDGRYYSTLRKNEQF